MSTAAPITRKKMSAFQQAMLSFYWFATNAHWTAIMMVLMPSQVKSAVGGDIKGSMLGLALGIGSCDEVQSRSGMVLQIFEAAKSA